MSEEADNSPVKWGRLIANTSFLLLTAGLFFTIVYLLRNVLHAIILGVLFAIILMPLQHTLLKRISNGYMSLSERFRKKNSENSQETVQIRQRIDSQCRWISSFISVLLAFCLIVLPLSFLIISVAEQGQSTLPSALQWVEKELPKRLSQLEEKYHLQEKMAVWMPSLNNNLSLPVEQDEGMEGTQVTNPSEKTQTAQPAENEKAPEPAAERELSGSSHKVPENAALMQGFIKVTKNIGNWLGKGSLKILSRAWMTVFNFFIMLFVMFHIFLDGHNIWNYLKQISPLGDEVQRRVVLRIKEVSKAIFYGIFGTALIQGILAMCFFKMVGIPALFWGFLLGICSIIPFVGTGLIWVPATAYMFLTGNIGKGIFLLVSCGGIVANIDSFVRPLLIKQGGKTGMSYLVLFFSILGGLQTFGLVGIIYGPLLMGMCSICLLIYSTHYKVCGIRSSSEAETGEVK